jgi:hypothetical protein
MKNLPINDIFPLVDVPDNSAYIFFTLLCIGIVSLVIGIFYLYKTLRVHKISREKKYIIILKNCDFQNARQCSYKISYYGQLLAKTAEEKKAIEAIVAQLSSYKYKKDAPEISDEIKEQFQRFLHTIEMRHA